MTLLLAVLGFVSFSLLCMALTEWVMPGLVDDLFHVIRDRIS